MPLYEFQCTACGREVEELLPASRAGRSIPCPGCGAAAERRLSVFAAPSSTSSSSSAACASPLSPLASGGWPGGGCGKQGCGPMGCAGLGG